MISPQPKTSLATLRPDIASMLMEFSLQADREGFIAQQVLPIFDVAVQGGVYPLMEIEEILQESDTERATGAGYSRGEFEFTSGTFATQEHGKEFPVDDRYVALYENYIDAEMVAAELARDAVLRNYEMRVAAAVFNATTFASYTDDVTNEWDKSSTATPISDVKTAKQAMRTQGITPDTLIINYNVYTNLLECEQIRERIQYVRGTLPGELGITDLRLAFDLPKILVAGGLKNTAKKPTAASISDIWDDEYAMLCKTDNSTMLRPCIGRTFHWSRDGSAVGGAIETYRDETKRSDIVRCRFETQEKILLSQAGYLLSNITTTT